MKFPNSMDFKLGVIAGAAAICLGMFLGHQLARLAIWVWELGHD